MVDQFVLFCFVLFCFEVRDNKEVGKYCFKGSFQHYFEFYDFELWLRLFKGREKVTRKKPQTTFVNAKEQL